MTAPRLKTVVLGAGGLVGGELLRLLSMHPQVEAITAVSKSQAGVRAHEVHRSLLHLPDIELVDLPYKDAAQGADVVFCTLPHGESRMQMDQILSARPRCIIDLAADFRIRDSGQFEQAYGTHQCPQLLKEFIYGLPEAFAHLIRQSRLIANPGCFATAVQLLLLPLADKKLLADNIAVFGVTGSSGAGVTLTPATHHPFRDGNLFAYKMLAHQHEAEINQTISEVAGEPRRVRLLAHSGPFVRGIHATAYFNENRLAKTNVEQIYREYYKNHPFIMILNRPPQVAEVALTNYVHLHILQKGSEVEIALALDNLVKGAAGQAMQNMNLVFGLDETAGLTFPGAFPC